mmetsp:Transcript_85992/g.216451  ORF Transcript_85992/g.216451 Transcript_85992/m.216451 type:complete len:239 (+) Transcript_85992:86-802(+)
MGIPCTKPKNSYTASEVKGFSVPVLLHIYDLGTGKTGQVLNTVLRPLGTGAFHCGIEVYNLEWSYSFVTDGEQMIQGTGVFCSRPRKCSGHNYSQTVAMGSTRASEDGVLKLIRALEKEWTVDSYDLLGHNCCHFANELCIRLGVGPLPDWVTSLPRMGATLAEQRSAAGALCCRPRQGDALPGGAFVALTAFCCGSSVGGGMTGAEDEKLIETKPMRATAVMPGCDMRMPRAHDLRI